MNKNVIISVKGIQSSTGKDSNKLELITEGKYYRKGADYFITYKESQVTGMDGTTTTLKVSDGVITLMRFGSVNTQFIFEKGQKHMSYYDTVYGTFTVSVVANQVNINMDDAGGEIRVDYDIEIDNNKTGENDLHLFIREAGHINDKPFGSISS
jgi:uncharacterized beta-barrel protein YwiB (DUF1934 family)